ncbi:MAG: AAA family ATPase [Actinobacteria bacterium]|nr:AAA family ATPase [Actinomycetota bacterium]
MPTCSNCGHENTQEMRFCGRCGTALVPARAREVRKTVTVLFADVMGSTALGERHDPELVRQVMSRYFEEMKDVLEHHGGTVEKFVGDAIMTVFGIPILHEDDARRALHAALQMREQLATLNRELERDFGIRLEARIGVNTGEVLTGETTTGERLATGDAVNVAARLEQAAAPDDILVGDQTVKLASAAIEVEPIEPLFLKGKDESVAAYRLLRVVEGAPAFARRLDAPLIGRHEELAFVRNAFDRAVSERRCRLVTVFGPPGIGKSRLARQLAEELSQSAVVLSGECLPYGEGITYWPLRDIFLAAGAERELDVALAAEGPEEIFWTVRKALERRGRERPLVLVVEDIHWAEPTLLDLIEHLADWTREAQLLLLCLARPELLDERPTWGAGRANAETLTLEPLAKSEAEELIESLLGGSQLEDEARARIQDVAEGNPLFVEQLLAMVTEEGEADRVPSTIHALLAARLDALPEKEQDLLERASVIGFDFEWEALGELAPDRRRPGGAQLAALVRKEMIRPHEAIEDTFRFRHMLIRDVAYERIPKRLRSDLHERYARWLNGRAEQFDEMVGYHLEQAYRCVADLGSLGDRARALARQAAERLAASGQRSYMLGDMPAAANLLERAAALLPTVDRRRLDLLPSLGRALRETGHMQRAISVLSDAVQNGHLAGARGVAADAAVTLSSLRLHTSPHESVGQAEVIREVENAIPVFKELRDHAALARALSMSGMLRFWRGEAKPAIKELQTAARYAHEAGDRAQEVEALQGVLIATLRGPTPTNEALERVEEIRAAAGTNRTLQVSVWRTSAQLEAMRARFDVARGLVTRARGLAEELGLEVLGWRVAQQAGEIEMLAGDAVAAERELSPARDAFERIGERGYLATIAPMLADALLDQGRDEEAMPLTEVGKRSAVPEDADAQIRWRLVRAKALARRGEIEEGRRLARDATAIAARTDYLNLRAQAVADLAEVLSLADRPEESAALVQEAIRLYERKGNLAALARLARTWADDVE